MSSTRCARRALLALVAAVAADATTWSAAAVVAAGTVAAATSAPRQHVALVAREAPLGNHRGGINGRGDHGGRGLPLEPRAGNVDVANVLVDAPGSVMRLEFQLGAASHGDRPRPGLADGAAASLLATRPRPPASPPPPPPPQPIRPTVSLDPAAADGSRDGFGEGGAGRASAAADSMLGRVETAAVADGSHSESHPTAEGLTHRLERLVDRLVFWAFPSRSRVGQQRIEQLHGIPELAEADGKRHGPGELVEVLRKTQQEWDVAEDEFDQDLPGGHAWFLALLVLLAIFGVVLPQIGVAMKVHLPGEEPGIGLGGGEAAVPVAARGRECWIVVLFLCTLLLSAAVFLVTFIRAAGINAQLREKPETARTVSNGGEPVTLSRIRSPGERAFEAGAGVAFSVAFACLFLLYRRFADSVPLRAALLGLFGLRGATLSLLIAGALELLAVSMLPQPAGAASAEGGGSGAGRRQHTVDRVQSVHETDIGLWSVLMMLSVGISEELAKASVLLAGVVLVASEAVLLESGVLAGCCWRCWRVLVETPRGLMLAGAAAGFGFMCMENGLYLVEVASTPPMQFDDSDASSEEDRFTMWLLRLITITIRIVLNIHPWLAGITAARIAQVVFVHDRRTHVHLTVSELAWAIAPSAAAHMAYDLIVLASPALVALLAPLVFWVVARSIFGREWDKLRAEASPPTAAAVLGELRGS